MTQADRDRLVTLKKAKKRLITQREAAEELQLSVRQVKRLLYGLKKHGDKAVVHGLRGKPSKRKIAEGTEKEAVRILSAPVYKGFGPTLACEYLGSKHGIEVSRETVRQWMIRSKLWRAKEEKVKQVHLWRPRRSRFGELVQWDTSEHDWLEGRGERLYLIAMIDDATRVPAWDSPHLVAGLQREPDVLGVGTAGRRRRLRAGRIGAARLQHASGLRGVFALDGEVADPRAAHRAGLRGRHGGEPKHLGVPHRLADR
jgi:hypothetical protein